jgi:hypothetical protein
LRKGEGRIIKKTISEIAINKDSGVKTSDSDL